MSPQPTLVVLAGPNGAGKSTFFERRLRGTGLRFVNANILARTMAPEDPAQARVISRVALGGHDVPDEKLFSRFPRTLANLAQAARFVDETHLYDNSDARYPYRPLGRLERGQIVEQHPPIPAWAAAVLGAPDQ